MLAIEMAGPLLVNDTSIGVLAAPFDVAGKVMDSGVKVVGTRPVPFTVIVCGLSGAPSVIVIVPVRAPVAEGVNVTEIVHVASPASDAPQLFV